jgi:hypothetical protein
MEDTLCLIATIRRAEALGWHYEARRRGLNQATQVDFVAIAEAFMPAATDVA